MPKLTPDRFSLENQRINIFIGSTSENSQTIAHKIKDHFDESQFNVDVWDEDVFEPGTSNLQNLEKFSAIYDYAIMVFVNDDTVLHRGQEFSSTPPNLIFEYGLFLGRMGAQRAFIMAEKSVEEFIKKSFSDIQGITIGKTFQYDNGVLSEESLLKSSDYVKEKILRYYKNSASISFLPSAALAIGYFNNFIDRVMASLNLLRNQESSQLELVVDRGKDHIKVPFYRNTYELRVIIPEKLLESGYGFIQDKIVDYGFVRTGIKNPMNPEREFGVYWKRQTPEEIARDGFVIYDFPTTLYSSQKVIDIMLKEGGTHLNTQDLDIKELVGEKEIYNFIKTIKFLVRASDKAYMRDTIRIELNPEEFRAD